MSKITYVKGDATRPVGDGSKIICHICNDIGAWGAGFVLALSKRWKAPEEDYRFLFQPTVSEEHRRLGAVRLVPVEYDHENNVSICVANMIGQNGINHQGRQDAPIRYPAVKDALSEVNKYAEALKASLHMPRIGCGLAGGEWEEIEKIINEVVTVEVTVYDFE